MADTTELDHPIVDRAQWFEASIAQMAKEKELTRLRDELAQERRALPWLEITEPYQFDGPTGSKSLPELFDGRSQLVMWNFMFAPDADEGCPNCSFWADSYDGTESHLAVRDTTLCAVSRAPVATLAAYQQRMGWSFPWYSSGHSRFNYDIGVSFEPGDLVAGNAGYNFGTQDAGMPDQHGLSVFTRTEDDRVFLTYQTFSRGVDPMNSAYQMLDLTAKGRDEGAFPWPMAWLKRHDQYGES